MDEGDDTPQVKILVVDDEAIIRLDLAHALSDVGFDVIEVGNADEAIAVLTATSEVAMMITDVELFGSIDGVNLAWEVRRKWPPVHVIVVSGLHRANELDLPDQSRFFVKPYDVKLVVSAAKELLR